MAEKPLDFAARAAALRKKREEERNSPSTSPNVVSPEPADIVHAPFGSKPKKRTKEPDLPVENSDVPRPDRIPGNLSIMRTMARLGSSFGDAMPGGRGMELLIGHGAETRRKFDHLKHMEMILASLRRQMSPTREAANVVMRRGIMRETGTEDLIQQFWESTEHDWSARPSTYTALLDELESRGFFESIPHSPQPNPPTPHLNKTPEHDPGDDKPRSPGRPHRGRPKRR